MDLEQPSSPPSAKPSGTSLRVRLQSLLRRLTTSTLGRKAFGALLVKVYYTGSAFVLSVLLARLLGVDQYGQYVFAVSWLVLLGVPAGLGVEGLLVRNVASYTAREAWALARGVMRWAFLSVAGVSLLVGGVAAGVAWWYYRERDLTIMVMLWFVCTLLPFTTLSRQQASALNGLRHPAIGQIPQLVAQPTVTLLLVGGAVFGFAVVPAAHVLLVLYGAAWVGALLLAVTLTQRLLPPPMRGVQPAYHAREWWQSVPAFLLSASAAVIIERTDLLMLGLIREFSEVSVYSAALRGASQVLFIPLILNTVLAPELARAHTLDDRGALQRIVDLGVSARFLSTIPVVIGFVLFGRWFLWLYGEEFTAGYVPLLILTVGQFAVAVLQMSNQTLSMTGLQHLNALCIGIGAVINVLLNALLIPSYGMYGGAIATSVSLIVSYGLATWLVWRRLGIVVLPLVGWLRRRRG